MTTSTRPVFSIVVPAHNEAENLEILLPRLYAAGKTLGDSFEVVLVNNASTDATVSFVEGLASAMPQLRMVAEPTMGYGRAVLTGLRSTEGEYIGIIRSDNQEKSEDLVDMFLALRSEGVDFYKAIRATRINDGLKRIIISRVFNFLFHMFFGLRSKDLNATPKVFTRRFYEETKLESLDWFLDAEMVIKAEKLGYSIRERQIEYLPRLKGKSSVRMRHIFEFLRNMLAWWSRLLNGRLLEK